MRQNCTIEKDKIEDEAAEEIVKYGDIIYKNRENNISAVWNDETRNIYREKIRKKLKID